MTDGKAVTIHDVAQKAGCSPSLVCIAFSGKGRIGAKTKERILAVAEEMGYTPNRAAQSLSRKEITIGVIIPRSPAVVQDLLRDNLIATLEQDNMRRCKCLMIQYDSTEESKLQALRQIDEKIDGIILEMKEPETEQLAQELAKLAENNKPVVGLVTSPSAVPVAGQVSVDIAITAGMAAQILYMNGCTRVGVIAGEQDSELHARMVQAFARACEQEGLVFEKVEYTDDLPEKAYLLTQNMLQQDSPPDGIFVTNYCSPMVCRAIEECGFVESIKVVGVDLCDEIRTLLKNGQLLATLYQNQSDQARKAGQHLLDYILHQTESKQINIKPELVLRSNMDSY